MPAHRLLLPLNKAKRHLERSEGPPMQALSLIKEILHGVQDLLKLHIPPKILAFLKSVRRVVHGLERAR